MNKLLSFLVILLLSFALTSPSVEAKRFGGGSNLGKYRMVRNNQYHHARPTEPKQVNTKRWLGPLAGLIAGGLLASLFAGSGLGGLLGILLLVGLAIFILRLLARKRFAQVRSQQYAGTHFRQTTHFQANSMSSAFATPGFKEAFLRQAKVLFIRLQAAYDAANLADLQEFTTPEVFAEIRLQISERGLQENVTEVVTLNVELLEDNDLASVRFTGNIRETRGGPALPFTEIWHFQQTSNSGWLVAGIQQLEE